MQMASGFAALSEGVYPINDILGHWQFCPMLSEEPPTGGEAKKIVSSLCISGWMKSNCANCACLHAVIMVLVRLHIGSKFEVTVFLVVDLLSGD